MRSGGLLSGMAEQSSLRGVRVVGIVIAVLGVVFLVAGVATYATVSSTLADQHITVSDDADHFAGKQVKGPFTAYAQADIINQHALEIEASDQHGTCV